MKEDGLTCVKPNAKQTIIFLGGRKNLQPHNHLNYYKLH